MFFHDHIAMRDRKALSVLSGSLTKVPLLIVDHLVASGIRGGGVMHTLTGFRILLFFSWNLNNGASVQGAPPELVAAD